MKTMLKRFAAITLLAALLSGCAVYAPPGSVAVAPGYYPYFEPVPPVVFVPWFRFDYRYRRYR